MLIEFAAIANAQKRMLRVLISAYPMATVPLLGAPIAGAIRASYEA
jgi:hypothetical protein